VTKLAPPRLVGLAMGFWPPVRAGVLLSLISPLINTLMHGLR
jgi:hypothetical protein